MLMLSNVLRLKAFLILRPLNKINKKGKENIYLPPIVNIAAKKTDIIIANLFKNCAIFLVLVFANQFSIR